MGDAKEGNMIEKERMGGDERGKQDIKIERERERERRRGERKIEKGKERCVTHVVEDLSYI